MMLLPNLWALIVTSPLLVTPSSSVRTGVRGAAGTEYVLLSQPQMKSVVYIKVNVFTHTAGNETYPLVTANLKNPLGIAYDKKYERLFVADPELAKVFWYKLIFTSGVIHTDGKQYVAASGCDPRWVAADEEGNIFITDETNNQIWKVTHEQLKNQEATPEVVYAGSSTGTVSTPGGISADGAELFWGNTANGKSAGVVIRGAEVPSDANVGGNSHVVSKNVEKAYGVCASQNNVYYSGNERYLYGVKKTGGDAAVVADILVKPRGCAWDGDGTVYVADQGGGAVWAFPSSMHTLGPAQISNLFSLTDPYGVAIFEPPAPKPVDFGLGGFMEWLPSLNLR